MVNEPHLIIFFKVLDKFFFWKKNKFVWHFCISAKHFPLVLVWSSLIYAFWTLVFWILNFMLNILKVVFKLWPIAPKKWIIFLSASYCTLFRINIFHLYHIFGAEQAHILYQRLVMGRTSFFEHQMNSNVFIYWYSNSNTLSLVSNDRILKFEHSLTHH